MAIIKRKKVDRENYVKEHGGEFRKVKGGKYAGMWKWFGEEVKRPVAAKTKPIAAKPVPVKKSVKKDKVKVKRERPSGPANSASGLGL